MFLKRNLSEERVATALESPLGDSQDAELRAYQATAAALAPAVFPSESYRSELWAQLLRESKREHKAGPGSGATDGATDVASSVEVSTDHGRMVMADIEDIDEERAAQAAQVLARIAERHGAHAHR